MPILGTIASQVPGKISVGSFESIATVYLSSGSQSTVEFTSIPSTYKHLHVRYVARSGRSRSQNSGLVLRVNGSYPTYSHEMSADGSTVATGGGVPSINGLFLNAPGVSAPSNVFGSGYIDIFDYANTNKHRTIGAMTGTDVNGAGMVKYSSALLQSTSAVSSLTFETVDGGTNIQQYSHFALYGIKGE